MGRRWSRAEDAELERACAAAEPRAEIARRLRRSPDAVDARRRALGLPPRARPRPWSAGEDALIRAARDAGIPDSELAPRIGRRVEAVRRRRRQLGLARAARRPYSPEEDAALRQAFLHGRDALDALGPLLGRAPEGLRLRARALGLHAPKERRRWQPGEDELLRTGYARGLTCRAIAERLPVRRTPGAVAARARKLGLATYARRWSAADEAALARLAAAGLDAGHVGAALPRTREATAIRARKLGVRLPAGEAARRAPWTPAELDFLQAHAGEDPRRLATALGRSPRAVSARLRALELPHARSPHHAANGNGPAEGERRLILREYRAGDGRRLLALAARLGRSPGEVKRIAEQNGHAPRS